MLEAFLEILLLPFFFIRGILIQPFIALFSLFGFF